MGDGAVAVRPGYMCGVQTHCWQEGIFEFINTVKQSWPSGAKNIWVCFLANPQNCDISVVVGTATDAPLKFSPFALALNTAREMLVVPNMQVSIYERLWCVYEAHFALHQVRAGNL